MRIPRATSGLIVIAAAAALVACGNSTGPVGLTQAQVEDLVDALAAVGRQSSPLGSNVRGDAPARVLGVQYPVDETASCPGGGTVRSQGMIDLTETTFSANLTQTFTNCVSTSSRNTRWTFNGNPNLTTQMSGTFSQSGGTFTMSGTQSGGISYSSPHGGGSCSVDLSLNVTGNMLTDRATGSVVGTVCGRAINQTVQ
jgi:hypothetical protein